MTESQPGKKPRVLILWGSQSGNCQALAEGYSERFRTNDWWSDAVSMEDFKSLDLSGEPLILIVTSTWGEGDPPENAIEFVDHFFSESQSRLESTRFSVLALGDTNYADFCEMGKRFDARLEELGAIRVHDRTDCDVDYEDDAETWFNALIPKLYSYSFETFAREIPAGGIPSLQPPAPPKEDLPYGKKNPFPATLLVNKRLNQPGAFKDTRHLEFSLEGSGFSYEVGDVIGTHPVNDPELIDEMIEALPFNITKPLVLKDGTSIPIREALLEHYDVRTVTKALAKKWIAKTYHPYLHAIVEDDDSLAELIDGIEVIDLLKEYPAEFKDGQEFVGMLRKLNPRLYSIASSLTAHPDQVHLTVAKVEYETKGRHRKGVASNFLCDRMKPGDTVRVFMQISKHFRLPTDLETDVIMVGPGTGIAPFRAFLQERATTKATGRNWLFFGNPHEATDFFYEDELTEYQQSGVLSRLDLAWSRDQKEKIYVQDKMREARDELWQWIEGGAHFYVCGDATRMAGDVDLAMREAIQQGANLSDEDTYAYVDQMKKDHRYQRDVY